MIFNNIYHLMSIKFKNMYNSVISYFVGIYYIYFVTPEPIKPFRQNAIVENYEEFIAELKNSDVSNFYDLSDNFNNNYDNVCENNTGDVNVCENNTGDVNVGEDNVSDDKNCYDEGILRANTDSSIYYNYYKSVDLD